MVAIGIFLFVVKLGRPCMLLKLSFIYFFIKFYVATCSLTLPLRYMLFVKIEFTLMNLQWSNIIGFRLFIDVALENGALCT